MTGYLGILLENYLHCNSHIQFCEEMQYSYTHIYKIHTHIRVYTYLYKHPHTLALHDGLLWLMSTEMNNCICSSNIHHRNPSWCWEQINQQQQLPVPVPLHLAQFWEAAECSSDMIYTLYKGHESLFSTSSTGKQGLGTAGVLRPRFEGFEQNWGQIWILVETICFTKTQKGGSQGRAEENMPW